jgi:hypothetical protein
LDSNALVETRQIYLDYVKASPSARPGFAPASNDPNAYVYDRRRAVISAVEQLLINAEV